MNLDHLTQRIDRAAEHIPPRDQRFADALPHELALAFVDVAQWSEPPQAYGPDFDLAWHLCDCYVAFDDAGFNDLLDDLRDAADLTAATWRLRLHVLQHPPASHVPGEEPWVSFLQHLADAHFDLMPDQHAKLSSAEQERLFVRLLETLRADLRANKRYRPDWIRFVELAEAGAFA